MWCFFGGCPWWPAHEPWPVFGNPAKQAGQPLRFVAQINFGELPWNQIDGLPVRPEIADLPRSGLLQFFVEEDPAYGLEDFVLFGENQVSWRLIYRPELRPGTQTLPADRAPNLVGVDFPVGTPPNYCVTVTTRVEESQNHCVGWEFDFRVSDLAIEMDPGRDHGLMRFPEWSELFGSPQTPLLQLGGHPSCEQGDPRGPSGPNFLLAQFGIASLSGVQIMWGDGGAAKLLAHGPAHSEWGDVYYSWDCG